MSATPNLATTVSYTYTVDDLVNDTGDANTADGVCDTGSGCTLRAAIEQANANTGATQINVPSGTITLSAGELNASGDMFITGGVGGGTTTVDAGGNSRVISIGGGSVEIADLTITGGSADTYGGGVYLDYGSLTLTNVALTGNAATSVYDAFGGGIYVGSNGSLWLINSTVSGNAAYSTSPNWSAEGGGVFLDYGAAYMRDTTIGGATGADGNTAGSSDTYGYGGGVYNYYGNLVAENVTVSHDAARSYGGGVYAYGSTTVNGGAVTDNSADGGTFTSGYAGGVYNGYTLTMTGTNVANNIARGIYGWGGGIYANYTTTLTDVNVTGNTARATSSSNTAGGGGIYADYDLQMTGGSIANNVVTLDGSLDPTTDTIYIYGGGLYTSEASTLDDVTITGNSAVADNHTGAAYGGGVDNEGQLSVTNSVISSNSASGHSVYGGGIYGSSSYNVSLSLSGVQIDGNSATGVDYSQGGAIESESYAKLHDVSMDSNAATATGTDASVYGGALLLGNSGTLDHVLIDNTAVQAPDAGSVYGGAVWNGAAATMTHVDVRNTNVSAGYLVEGAGIYTRGGINITNSAITGNAGDVTGVAINAYSDGGGIFEEPDYGFTVSLVNVTIAANDMTASGDGDAYDGGIYVGDNTQLTNVTLADNNADTDDGGLYVYNYIATFKNTIVAGNTSTGTTNCEAGTGGTLRSTGYNLEDADSCGFHNKGDQINTDPLLGPLQDNGGDTLTMAPDTSPTVSPAIDNATMNGAPKTDQRGVARPQGAGPDIGAVEVVTGEAPAITSANNATFGVGVPGLFTVTTTGDPTPSLSHTGTLPSGVQFIDNGDGTASIAGTPGTGTAGSYPITITATNGVGADATQQFTLTVVTRLAITNTSLADGTVGTPYSQTLAATGGTGSYTWSVLSGKLPKGLKLSSGGTISGTPHASGSFPFTILVHDTSSPAMTATASFTITIAPRR